jgi:hypothetical protein
MEYYIFWQRKLFMKKDEFENWMIKQEKKAPTTASQYAHSIDLISRHHSQQTNKPMDLYNITDTLVIKGFVKDYGIGGKYQDIGENGTGKKGHGTVRNAMAAYARFLDYKKGGEWSQWKYRRREFRKFNADNS